jgi:hypothetical protein
MKQRRRIYYSAAQRSEIWDRWQAGEPMRLIVRLAEDGLKEKMSCFETILHTF